MINYILLVSRQGACYLDEIHASRAYSSASRQGAPGEMVPDDATEAEGQDRQGRDTAGPGTPHKDVQLLGVQRCANRFVGVRCCGLIKWIGRYEGCIQEIRLIVLRMRDWFGGQRVDHS